MSTFILALLGLSVSGATFMPNMAGYGDYGGYGGQGSYGNHDGYGGYGGQGSYGNYSGYSFTGYGNQVLDLAMKTMTGPYKDTTFGRRHAEERVAYALQNTETSKSTAEQQLELENSISDIKERINSKNKELERSDLPQSERTQLQNQIADEQKQLTLEIERLELVKNSSKGQEKPQPQLSRDDSSVANVYLAQMATTGGGINPYPIMGTLGMWGAYGQTSASWWGNVSNTLFSSSVQKVLPKTLQVAPPTEEERAFGQSAGKGMLLSIMTRGQAADQLSESNRNSILLDHLGRSFSQGGVKGAAGCFISYVVTNWIQRFGWAWVALLVSGLPPGLVSVSGSLIFQGILSIANSGLLGYLLRPLTKAVKWLTQKAVRLYKCAVWYTRKGDREQLLKLEEQMPQVIGNDEQLIQLQMHQYQDFKTSLLDINDLNSLIETFGKCAQLTNPFCMHVTISHMIKLIDKEEILNTGDAVLDHNDRFLLIRAIAEPKVSPSFMLRVLKLPGFKTHLPIVMALFSADNLLPQLADRYFSLGRLYPKALVAVQKYLIDIKRWDIPRQKLSCIYFRLSNPHLKMACGGGDLLELWKANPDFPKAVDNVINHSRILTRLDDLIDTTPKDQEWPQKCMIEELRKLLLENPEYITEKRLYYFLELLLRTGNDKEKRCVSSAIWDTDPILLGVYLQWAEPPASSLPYFYTDYDMRYLAETYRQALKSPHDFEINGVNEESFLGKDALPATTFLPDEKIWDALTAFGREALLDLVLKFYFNCIPASIFSKRPIVLAPSFMKALWGRVRDYREAVAEAEQKARELLTDEKSLAEKEKAELIGQVKDYYDMREKNERAQQVAKDREMGIFRDDNESEKMEGYQGSPLVTSSPTYDIQETPQPLFGTDYGGGGEMGRGQANYMPASQNFDDYYKTTQNVQSSPFSEVAIRPPHHLASSFNREGYEDQIPSSRTERKLESTSSEEPTTEQSEEEELSTMHSERGGDKKPTTKQSGRKEEKKFTTEQSEEENEEKITRRFEREGSRNPTTKQSAREKKEFDTEQSEQEEESVEVITRQSERGRNKKPATKQFGKKEEDSTIEQSDQQEESSRRRSERGGGRRPTTKLFERKEKKEFDTEQSEQEEEDEEKFSRRFERGGSRRPTTKQSGRKEKKEFTNEQFEEENVKALIRRFERGGNKKPATKQSGRKEKKEFDAEQSEQEDEDEEKITKQSRQNKNQHLPEVVGSKRLTINSPPERIETERVTIEDSSATSSEEED